MLVAAITSTKVPMRCVRCRRTATVALQDDNGQHVAALCAAQCRSRRPTTRFAPSCSACGGSVDEEV
jgi:hypothetical protein